MKRLVGGEAEWMLHSKCHPGKKKLFASFLVSSRRNASNLGGILSHQALSGLSSDQCPGNSSSNRSLVCPATSPFSLGSMGNFSFPVG